MPRFETLAFWFVSFWVCFFGSCLGVAGRHECRTTDAQYTVNQNYNSRISDHAMQLAAVRSEVKQEAIDNHKHHMYHLNSHCKVLDRLVCLEDRMKLLEGRTVHVIPQQMPEKRRTIDPSELEPMIPPQKLPIAPSDQ